LRDYLTRTIVDYLQAYSLPIYGLSEGVHRYDFKVDDKFFEQFEDADIMRGHANIEVVLHKKPNMLVFDIEIKGKVVVQCDRCLDDLELPVAYQANLYAKFGAETEEIDEDMMIISTEETSIDLSGVFYDYINLSLPLKKIHIVGTNSDKPCDPDMIAKLNQYLVNQSDDDQDDQQDTDPRWAGLKDLLN